MARVGRLLGPTGTCREREHQPHDAAPDQLSATSPAHGMIRQHHAPSVPAGRLRAVGHAAFFLSRRHDIKSEPGKSPVKSAPLLEFLPSQHPVPEGLPRHVPVTNPSVWFYFRRSCAVVETGGRGAPASPSPSRLVQYWGNRPPTAHVSPAGSFATPQRYPSNELRPLRQLPSICCVSYLTGRNRACTSR